MEWKLILFRLMDVLEERGHLVQRSAGRCRNADCAVSSVGMSQTSQLTL